MKFEIFVTNFLSDVFAYQNQKPQQENTSLFAVLVTVNLHVLLKR